MLDFFLCKSPKKADANECLGRVLRLLVIHKVSIQDKAILLDGKPIIGEEIDGAYVNISEQNRLWNSGKTTASMSRCFGHGALHTNYSLHVKLALSSQLFKDIER